MAMVKHLCFNGGLERPALPKLVAELGNTIEFLIVECSGADSSLLLAHWWRRALAYGASEWHGGGSSLM